MNSIALDNEGILWIGTDKGLNVFDPTNNKFKRYQNNPNSVNSISNNEVKQVFIDKQTDIWICTYGGGLNKFNKKNGNPVKDYRFFGRHGIRTCDPVHVKHVL